jgi:hypothetical protein
MRFAGILLAALLLQAPARASTFHALCDDRPCTIRVDAHGLTAPGLFLPAQRIALWFSGGETGYDAAGGTAAALGGGTAGAVAGGALLGPIGLLGGLVGGAFAGSQAGRTADLYFNVVGYDLTGRKATLSFRFVNPRPAERLRSELPLVTGLAMGQTRSLEDLRRGATGRSAPLPERLEVIPAGSGTPGGPGPQRLVVQPAGR